MNEVVFVAYARTAFCNRGGSLRNFSGVELAEKLLAAGGEEILQEIGLLQN